MPEVTISIGTKDFQVACQEGEEPYLQAAAKLLDTEASHLADQIGRMTESRMLLMAGLMLADKTAGLEESLRATEDKLAEAQAAYSAIRGTPTPEPERVEVPVIPPHVAEGLLELATRAESVAEEVEAKLAG